jgi:hypothetical protein
LLAGPVLAEEGVNTTDATLAGPLSATEPAEATPATKPAPDFTALDKSVLVLMCENRQERIDIQARQIEQLQKELREAKRNMRMSGNGRGAAKGLATTKTPATLFREEAITRKKY